MGTVGTIPAPLRSIFFRAVFVRSEARLFSVQTFKRVAWGKCEVLRIPVAYPVVNGNITEHHIHGAFMGYVHLFMGYIHGLSDYQTGI